MSDLGRDLQDPLNRRVLAGFSRGLDEIWEGSAGKIPADHYGSFVVFPVVDHYGDIRMVASSKYSEVL